MGIQMSGLMYGNSEICNGRVEDIMAIGPNGNAMYSQMWTLPLKICTQLRCLQGEMQLGDKKSLKQGAITCK